MAIPVVQLGTGNVGGHSLRALITNPEFELTGVWVSSDAKSGKDAAELAGLEDSTGVQATKDLDAVLATGPQCAVYNAMADNRLPEALEDYRRVLAAGINVVGSGPVFLQWPWQVLPEDLIKPLEDAAREGNSSLYVSGIDPAFRVAHASEQVDRPAHDGDRRIALEPVRLLLDAVRHALRERRQAGHDPLRLGGEVDVAGAGKRRLLRTERDQQLDRPFERVEQVAHLNLVLGPEDRHRA